MPVQGAAQKSQHIDLVVVDDDSLMLEIIAWQLRKTPVTHEFFDMPEEARQYLSAVKPKILIVDFCLPGTNGVDFLLELNDKNSICDSQVYLCSAVTPERRYIEQIDALPGVSIMPKADLCDGSTLLETLYKSAI